MRAVRKMAIAPLFFFGSRIWQMSPFLLVDSLFWCDLPIHPANLLIRFPPLLFSVLEGFPPLCLVSWGALLCGTANPVLSSDIALHLFFFCL